MTDAQVSQVAVEVIRTNLAVDAQVSQVAVEVLRPNAPKGVVGGAGSFALTGQISAGVYKRVVQGGAGTITLSGQAAQTLYARRFVCSVGSFTLIGQSAQFIRPNRLYADSASYTLSGQNARVLYARVVTCGSGSIVLAGQAASLARRKAMNAAKGTFILTGYPMAGRGILAAGGSFTFTGAAVSLIYRHARVISEIVRTTGSATNEWSLSTTTTDRYAMSELMKATQAVLIANGVTITPTEVLDRFPGALVEEIIRTSDIYSPAWRFVRTAAEVVQLASAVDVAFPAALTDTFELQSAINAIRSILVLEALRLIDPTDGDATYHMQLVDALVASDSLSRFLSGSISDSWGMTETTAVAPRFSKSATESVTIADVLSQKLILRITAADTFALADSTSPNWIFKPILTDGVEIAVGYIEPNGSFTTWAVNTRTGAVTEYQNFVFNSFAQIGHKYLGASDAGLYELDGADDDGTDVIAHIKSGYAQFGGSKYSSFKAAYLGMRGDGNIILKLDTGDGKSYTYQTVIQDMQSTKVRLGKGLRARYFSFELISTGPDFDLDTIEFIPLVAQRRV